MSAPTSRSSETGTSSTHTYHGANENLSGGSPGQKRIDEEKKHAALLAQLEFEQLESERIAARAAVARTKMLLLRLEADEEDSGDLIDCDDASHLSKTDKLEKRTVTLGYIEPAPESSPTTAPRPPPTACSEINSASPRNTDSNMSESTLADAIILAIKTARKETSKIVNEPSKTLADLPSFCGNVMNGSHFDRFERPDAIIKQELNKLRRMTPMNGGMGNISSFANKVNNCVAAIRMNKLSYLSTPEMTDEIVDKFNDILKFKWCEWDSQNSDEPELVMLSAF
ncbi:hypothetical protein EVAR_35492_1 [Eumeta japonica]|uniref:Uncharacterized protein n=1 Tax=Eumeta variegata TaxID=151549 RepID=A0A4C1X8Q3_EUMVA|nr:hypothetical protein EVAR_35492_1 [Eumeta japonica]